LRKADLHCHSTFSDGTLSPTQLVATARAAGLAALALTDHDTVEGVPEFLAAGDRHSFHCVPGTELSLDFKGTTHMLGYRARGSPAPELSLDFIQRFREDRNRGIQARLEALGFRITWEDVCAIAGNGLMGKPHFAIAMLEAGIVGSRKEAFDRFLGKGKPAYVNKRRLTAQEGIRLLLNSDYAPVLAHPGSLGLKDDGEYDAALSLLHGWGLVGVEAFHPDNGKRFSKTLSAIAARLGLVRTNGSDFHGANKKIPLNWVLGHSPLSVSVVEELERGISAAKERLGPDPNDPTLL
jgi:predicted metal-dependent phosphoesterase TrpH